MACNMSSDMTSNGNIATDLNSVQQCLRLLKTKTLVFCDGASSLQVNQVSATTCVECLPVKSFMYCISDIFTQPMTQRDKKKKLTLTSVSITSSPDRVVWTTINDSRTGIQEPCCHVFSFPPNLYHSVHTQMWKRTNSKSLIPPTIPFCLKYICMKEGDALQ